MNKYLITSPQFTGTAEALYINNELSLFDFTKCQMNLSQKLAFKEIVPILESDIEAAFAKTKATVVRTDYEVTFEMFYNGGLPKRNRLRADKAWNRLTKTEQVKAYYGLKRYMKLAGLYPVHPDTYLTDKRWEDE